MTNMSEQEWNPMRQQFESVGPTLAEFLLARIAEDEQRIMDAIGTTPWAVNPPNLLHDIALRHLGDCEAKRRIIEWHKAWPVLVETPPTFDHASGDDLSSVTFSISKRIMWATEQQYRACFGVQPPTGPVLRLLALPYVDHPDFQDEWA